MTRFPEPFGATETQRCERCGSYQSTSKPGRCTNADCPRWEGPDDEPSFGDLSVVLNGIADDDVCDDCDGVDGKHDLTVEHLTNRWLR